MDFEILSERNRYQGRIFAVDQVSARMPNGKIGLFDLVKHQNSVTIIPLDEDGNIWFVRQYRLGAGKILLELPAGVLDPQEDPQECAHRELREETGMSADSMVKLGKCFLAPGYSTEAMYFFLARGLKQAPLEQDEDEFIEVERFPQSQVFRMVDAGEIEDSKTLAALLLASPYLHPNAP